MSLSEYHQQSDKANDAKDIGFENKDSKMSLEEGQQFIDFILNTDYWKNNYPLVRSGLFQFHDRKKLKVMRNGFNVIIRLPESDCYKQHILDGLIQIGNHNRTVNTTTFNDPNSLKMFLKAIDQYMGISISKSVKESFKSNGVEVAKV